MKIRTTDVYSGKKLIITGKFEMDHTSSSYGLPDLVIEEWGGKVMSHKQWMLNSCEVVEINDEEQDFLNHWRRDLGY